MPIKYKDGKIEDLDFTITLTDKCSLSCDYCPLLHGDRSISFEKLDEYILFFQENILFFQERIKNLVFIFFGWEPLLEFEKIRYFIDKMFYFWIKTKFVIYTNGLHLPSDLVPYITSFPDYNKRIVLSISIDGDKPIMTRHRMRIWEQYGKLTKNISLLKEAWVFFHVSKVLIELKAQELFENLIFLHNLSPVKIDFTPISGYYRGDQLELLKRESIKGVHLFINYLLKNGNSELGILQYLGLPDDLKWYKSLYRADIWLYGDVSGEVFSMIDGLSIFSSKKLFSPQEKELITVWSLEKPEKILSFIADIQENREELLEFVSTWCEREFPGEPKAFSCISHYFIRQLLIHRYRPMNNHKLKSE